ncbi:MAG TPA: hypothetical protein EYG75_06200 [Campylobacterales bacterium]|nr:hypothetical protein [Campylobacterales bacterium]
MSGYFTDREEIFPSIFIESTEDNTQSLAMREGGQVCGMGWVNVGNPLHPIAMSSLSQRVKTTNKRLYKGDAKLNAFKNMSAYTIKDFHRNSNNRTLHLSRIMGIDSTIKIVKVEKVGEELLLTSASEVDIFKNGTMESWEELESTSPIEMLIKFCPTSKVTVRASCEEDVLTVYIEDEFARTLYKVSGNTDPHHLDDGGTSDYIGNRANCNYLTIKTDIEHVDYLSDFSISETYNTGLAKDLGDWEFTTFHKKNLRKVMQKSSYFVALGVESVILLEEARRIAHEFSTRMIMDLVTKDLSTAVLKKTTLGFSDENTDWFWSRADYRFAEGVQNIALSGLYAGIRTKVNIDGKKGRAENRMVGIAGVDYPINRTITCGLEDLTREEKIILTNNRINTIETRTVGSRDVLVFSDVLSGHDKNTQQKSSPIADTISFMKKEAGFIMEAVLFKSNTNAEARFRFEFNLFIEDCKRNNYFDLNVDEPVGYTMHVANAEEQILEIWAYMDGVMRKGRVKFNMRKGA